MSKVLVLDGNQRSALAMTRSLGRQGISVLVADSTPHSLAGHSRYCARECHYPSPDLDVQRFVAHLAQMIDQEGIGTVFPMTDITTATLLQHKEALGDVKLPYPAFAAYETASNKAELFQRAEKLGIPTPQTHYINTPSDLDAVFESLQYPIVIKPAKSNILVNNQWVSTEVSIAESAQVLRQRVAATPWLRDHPYMLQEYIQGQGQGLFALYNQGTPLAFFSHKRLREKPPRGGVSVYCESAPVNPAMHNIAEQILGDLAWHGVAMVEFKVAADGTPYLMEINARFWGSLELAVRAGVDFPYLLYQMAQGEKPAPVVNYQEGQRLRWLLGDLDHLYLVLKDPSIGVGAKLGAALHLLTTSPFGTDHDTFRISDPGPFLHELRHYL